MGFEHTHPHRVAPPPCEAERECERFPLAGEDASRAAAEHRPRERRRLLWAMGLTGTMMVVEAVFGFLTNSLALLSDAGHMFTHFFALAVSYFAIVIASMPTTRERSFGLYRVEVLAAALNGVTLLLVTLYIFYEAAHRFIVPKPIASMQMLVVAMLVVAVLGLAVNLSTALILWRAGEKHDLNVRSAFLHMLGDTASSVGIVATAAVIHVTSWLWLDPAVSVLIAALIVIWAWQLMRDSVHVLLESTPRHLTVGEVVEALRRDPDVRALCSRISGAEHLDIHDIHIWEITSRMYAMTAHIALPDHELRESAPLLARIRALVRERFAISHTVLEIEPASSDTPR
jgi:cobalt-zinc-cadmium efflux system protein